MAENTSSPYLFLDFDGVLLNHAVSETWDDEFGPRFDPEKCAYIEKLQQETGCKIVVISSWRNRAEGGKAAMERMVVQRDLGFSIHDTVILSSAKRLNRSEEINLYISESPEPIGHIAILDDSMRDGFFSPCHYSVHIQPHWTGMTKDNYQMTRDVLLNGPNQALVRTAAPRFTGPQPDLN